MTPSRYLGWCAAALVSLVLAAVALCVVADPYYVFGSPALPGVNVIKPRVYQRAEMAKAHQLGRVRPRTLLIGNSRTEIGLDPASPLWPEAMRPVFNAAVAGGGPGDALLMLERAVGRGGAGRAGSVATVVLGIDFPDFLSVSDGPPPAPRGDDWRDLWWATLTIDAVTDSLSTLAGQDAAGGVTMRPDGFNPMRDYAVQARRIGYFPMFSQKLASYRKSFAAKPVVDFDRPESDRLMAPLRRLIRTAAGGGRAVVVVLHPYHVTFTDLLAEMGFGESFESWRRAVVRVVEAERQGGARAIRLLDFTGDQTFRAEPAPVRGDRSRDMRWYWEPGHYKSALGEHIIAAILGGVQGFGVEIR